MTQYDCWCDYDIPEFCTVTTPHARKRHKCDECGGIIEAGEQYEYTFGKWEGDCSSFKVCQRCADIRQWVKNNVPCLCWTYGNMIGDCRDAIDAACERATEETKGLKFGFWRRIILRNRLNKQRANVRS